MAQRLAFGLATGSHMIWVKEGHLATLSIPDHQEAARGTLRCLIRNSGLTVDEFLALSRPEANRRCRIFTFDPHSRLFWGAYYFLAPSIDTAAKEKKASWLMARALPLLLLLAAVIPNTALARTASLAETRSGW
jgi:hypothetical protein